MKTPSSSRSKSAPKLRGISSIRMLGLLGTALALVSTLQMAHAATDTWSGSGSGGNWTTNGNWTFSPNVSTVSAYDSLVFQGTTELTNTNNFTAGTAFDGITFLAGSGTFNLMGNGILLSGQINNWVTSGTSSWTPGVINNSTSAVTINVPLTLDWGNYAFANTNLTGSIAIDGGLTANTGGVAVFGGTGSPITTTAGSGLINTTLTVDPNTGLINNLNGAGLLGSSGTGNLFALLPLATVSGGQVVAYGSSSYDSLNAGTTTIPNGADNNVLLNGNSTSTTYTTAASSVTDVNTITAATGTNTLTVSGTLVFGAGAADSVGGLYVTGGSNHQVFTFNATGATNAVTAGTTAAGGTIVIAVNSVPAQTSNEVENNEQIQNNAAGGPVTLIKTGPGSMYFNNATQGPDINSYSGGTYVDQGWLQGNATGVFGTGPIYVAGGATLYLETSQSNALYLSPGLGDNTNQGSIKFANNSQVQSGVLTLLGAPVTSAPGDRMSLNDAGATINFTNQVTGAGTLDVATQVTSATTIFELDNTTGNANNWTGGTIIESAGGSDRVILQDGFNNQIGANNGTSAGNMTFTAASTNTGSLTFDLDGHNDTVGALITNGVANTSGVYVNNSAGTTATLTIGDNGGTGTFNGIIENTSSALSIIKTGTGTQTLGGVNTYTGNTTINSGTLALTAANGGNGALASPSVTVNSGATLVLGNNDTLGYTVGRNVLTINDGTVMVTTSTDRDTFQNLVTMNGGTISAAGAGNSGGAYSWDAQSGNLLNATSDASGNPAVISAATAVQSSVTQIFSVSRGTDVAGFSPDLTISGAISNYTAGGGTNGLIITGSGNGGITVMSGANTFTSLTQIQNGIVNYQNSTAFGTDGAITVSSTATLQVQGNITGGSKALTIGGAGDTALGATGVVESVSGANSYAGPVTLSGNSTIAADAGSLALSGPIGDGGSGYAVTTAGAGTITLSGSSTYLGNTNVGNSLLIVTGSLNEAGNVVLSNATVGSVLAGTGNGTSSGVMGNVTVPANNGSIISRIAPGITGTNNSIGELTMSSLTMNGGQLVLALTNATTPGVTYSFINVTGSLTLPTTWSVSPSLGAEAGVYTVLTGGTSNIGAGAALPSINNPPGGPLVRPAIYTPMFSGNSLQLDVTGGAASIIWSGSNGSGGNAIWDVATTQNWNDSSASAPTGQFFDGDAVTFDDTGSNTNITIQPGTNGETTVIPSAITVSANTVNYTIGGNPISGATGLLKSGSDTLTLTGANTFTGATTLYAGIINYQNGTGFGTDSAITIATGSSATIQVQGGVSGGSQTLTLTGAGAPGGTGALENVSGANSYAGPISLTGNTTISSDAGTLALAGSITGAGNTLTLVGAGSGSIGGGIGTSGGGLTMNSTGLWTLGGNSTYTGNTAINSGTLTITGALGNTAVNLTGGILNLQNASAISQNTLTVDGGVLNDNVANGIAGSAALDIDAGVTTFTVSNSYTGATYIGDGAVLNISSLASGGTNSGIGSASSAAANLELDGGELVFTDTAASQTITTNRGFTLTQNGGTIGLISGSSTSIAFSGAIAFAGNGGPATLTLTGSDAYDLNPTGQTLSSTITDDGTAPTSIVKTGDNAWALSGNNSFSGGMTIEQGRVRINSFVAALGSGPVTVDTSGQLYLDVAGTYNNNISLSGSGVAELETSSTAAITGTGYNGALRIATSGVVLGGTVTLDGNTRVTARGGNGTISGPITDNSDGYSIEFGNSTTSTGQITLSNTNNFWGGGTIVSSGTVSVGASSTASSGVIPHGAGAGNVTINGGDSLSDPFNSVLNLAAFNLTINGLISAGSTGQDIVTDNGAGASTLSVGDNDAGGTYAGIIENGTNGAGILSLTKIGSGTEVLDGANTYSGLTSINGGDLTLGNATAIPTGGNITFGGGTLQYSSTNQVDYSSHILNSTSAISIDTNGQNVTYASSLASSNTGGLTKAGSGTLTLGATENYTGATDVTAGALNVTGALNGSSSTTVTDATLEGTGSIANGVTIGNGSNAAGSAVFVPGSLSLTGTFTLTSGTVSILSDGDYVFTLNSTTGVGSQLIAQGVSLDPDSEFTMNDLAAPGGATPGTVFTVIDTANGITGTFGNLPNGDLFSYNQNDYLANYNGNQLTLTVVPEPATWGLMISGLGMLIGLQRMRKRKSIS